MIYFIFAKKKIFFFSYFITTKDEEEIFCLTLYNLFNFAAKIIIIAVPLGQETSLLALLINLLNRILKLFIFDLKRQMKLTHLGDQFLH